MQGTKALGTGAGTAAMFLMVISVTVERERGGGAPEAGTGLLLPLFQEQR